MAWYWWYLIIGLAVAFCCGLEKRWDKETDGDKMKVSILGTIIWPLLLPIYVAKAGAFIRRLFK